MDNKLKITIAIVMLISVLVVIGALIFTRLGPISNINLKEQDLHQQNTPTPAEISPTSGQTPGEP